MQVTVYGGAGVIGGNKILLEADNTSLLFDFGIDYTVWSQYFEEYLKPRATRGLCDLFEVGLLPPLRGIYRDDLEPSWDNVWNRLSGDLHPRDAHVDAVLLSHAHLDHSGHISFLRPDIPVVCTSATAFLAKAIQDLSRGDFEKEVCYVIPREEQDRLLTSRNWRKYASVQRQFYFCDYVGLSSEAQAFWVASPVGRQIDCKQPGRTTKIGNVTIKCFPVDHSIYGATAFAVETSCGWVVYTGDLRLHGKMGHITREFVEEVCKLRPVVLICEGTNVGNIGEEPSPTEETVLNNALEKVNKVHGRLVVADFGPRNLERLLTFREVAARCGRKLAILTKDAYLLQALHCVMPEVPHPADDDTMVLYQEVKDAAKWERDMFKDYSSKGKAVQPEDIRHDEGRYILCLSFWDINELVDIRPSPGGMYIYSSSEAFTEEQCFDIKRLTRWLDHLGLEPVGIPDAETGKVPQDEKGFHASGHAGREELLEIIRAIRPRMLIPVHTENPEFFVEHLSSTMLVKPPTLAEAIPIE